jgi:hypothetical protein
VSLLEKKRTWRVTNLYIAGTSGDTKMNLERQKSTQVSAGKYQSKSKEDKIEKLKEDLEEIS